MNTKKLQNILYIFVCKLFFEPYFSIHMKERKLTRVLDSSKQRYSIRSAVLE